MLDSPLKNWHSHMLIICYPFSHFKTLLKVRYKIFKSKKKTLILNIPYI